MSFRRNIKIGGLKITFKTILPSIVVAIRPKFIATFSYRTATGGTGTHTINWTDTVDTPVESGTSVAYIVTFSADALFIYNEILKYLNNHRDYDFLKIDSVSLQIGLVNGAGSVISWITYGDVTTLCKQILVNEAIRNWLGRISQDNHTTLKADNTNVNKRIIISTTATYENPYEIPYYKLQDRETYGVNDIFIQLDGVYGLCGLFYESYESIVEDLSGNNWLIIPTRDDAEGALINNWDVENIDIVQDADQQQQHYYLKLPEVTTDPYLFENARKTVQFSVVCYNRVVAKIGIASAPTQT